MLAGNVPGEYNLQCLNNIIYFPFQVKCKGICPIAFQKMPSNYEFSALPYLLLSWSWKNESIWCQQFLCLNVLTFFTVTCIQSERITKLALARETWILFPLWERKAGSMQGPSIQIWSALRCMQWLWRKSNTRGVPGPHPQPSEVSRNCVCNGQCITSSICNNVRL